jgi:hypothetical protein
MIFDTTVLFFLQGLIIPIAAWVSWKRGYTAGATRACEHIVNKLVDDRYMTEKQIAYALDVEFESTKDKTGL